MDTRETLNQSQRYPFFFCIFTPNFSIELLILSFSKYQIYVTFCKTYQTKCKTRYRVFKILKNGIYSEKWSKITP